MPTSHRYALGALAFGFLLAPRAEASLIVPFVSDILSGVGSVQVYDFGGSPRGGLGPTAALSGPVQAVYGPDGNLYVTSIGNGQILRYNGQTGAFMDAFVSGIAHDSSGGFDVGPLGLAFGPDGNLYVTNDFTDEVQVYNGTTGALAFTFGSSHLSSPTGLVFYGGNLFVSSYNDNTIQEFASTGVFVRTLTSVGLVDIGFGFGGPEQLAIHNGNLFVTNFSSSDVEEYDLVTGNPVNGGIFVGGGSGGLAGATGLAFDFAGNLDVASNFTDQVIQFDATSGAFREVLIDANSGNNIEMGFLTAVPEPSNAVAVLFGLAGLIVVFRNRRRSAKAA
jgi:hypothetical protein